MSKGMENKLVPKLRFPGFADVMGWQQEELGKISDIVRGGSPRPIQDYLTMDKDGLNWLKIADVPPDSKYITMTKERVIYQALGSTRQVNDGDLILSNSMSFGRPYILKITTCIHDGWIAIRKISDKTFEDYLYYFISSELSQRYFLTQAAGAAVRNLNAEIIKLLPVYFPKNKEEQQKIVECLSSLDDLITAESEKLDVLKNHKKGLMQQLFPTEGEKVPKLRFPEFKDSGEWEGVTVGDVYDFKVTNSFSRENLNYKNGKVKNIHYGDIHTKFNSLFDVVKEKVPYINPDISITKIKTDSYCAEGDMIFADASEDLNDIGKSIEIINLNGEKLVPGLHTLLARQKEMKLYIGFGGYLFKTSWVRKQIQREAQGAKVLGISTGRISKVKISYPTNSKEQQKIVKILSSLDEKILGQKEKIEVLKLHKKSLMQQLFPNLN